MKTRLAGIVTEVVACVLVIAQIIVPGDALFHTWQYALALAVVAWLLIASVSRSRRGLFGISLLGALIVIADGLASGLLGPDTERLARAPGTVAPIPDIGAAAFFSNATPQSIARGDAVITIRRRNHSEILVTPGSRKFLGGSLLTAVRMPVAYVEAFDEGGNHLTVTQPTGAAFLSPFLLFRTRQEIAGGSHPIDGFALPAVNRSVKVVYFTPEDVARLHMQLPPSADGEPAMLYDVFDSRSNHSLGIGVAASGVQTEIGGVRLRATLGTYPQLVIASAPQPYILTLGLLLIASGIVGSFLQSDDGAMRESEGHEEEHGNREHRVGARHQES
ncbi:MAG TPA: hypothetical protein VMD07_09985 [Candidatus Acidoferrales bacterium]|nr:hypothetical protein [Candidatus Acidoferrales bacterium]